MTIAAYRDRTSGEYPISLAAVRARVNILFGLIPTPDILDAANVDPVEAVTPPVAGDNQVVEEGTPVLVDGTWWQTWRVVNLPAPRYFTYKNAIWMRVTDAEAATLDTELSLLPVRLRRLWDDSLQIDHDTDEGQLLIQVMESQWGEARTAVIMAPSGEL